MSHHRHIFHNEMLDYLYDDLEEGEMFNTLSAIRTLKRGYRTVPTQKEMGSLLNNDNRFMNMGMQRVYTRGLFKYAVAYMKK